MRLILLPQRLAVIRLEPDAAIPRWTTHGSFCSITRTGEEISIFCESEVMPDHPDKIDGWRAIRVAGQLDLHMTGVISTLAVPLAAKQISVFSISIHDTDYMLVREDQLDDAVDVLRRAGHRFYKS